MIATGLGGAACGSATAAAEPEVVEQPRSSSAPAPTDVGVRVETIDYERSTQPAVMRSRRRRRQRRRAPAFDTSEIPAFLRKQAD